MNRFCHIESLNLALDRLRVSTMGVLIIATCESFIMCGRSHAIEAIESWSQLTEDNFNASASGLWAEHTSTGHSSIIHPRWDSDSQSLVQEASALSIRLLALDMGQVNQFCMQVTSNSKEYGEHDVRGKHKVNEVRKRESNPLTDYNYRHED